MLPSGRGGFGTKKTGLEYGDTEGSISLYFNKSSMVFLISARYASGILNALRDSGSIPGFSLSFPDGTAGLSLTAITQPTRLADVLQHLLQILQGDPTPSIID